MRFMMTTLRLRLRVVWCQNNDSFCNVVLSSIYRIFIDWNVCWVVFRNGIFSLLSWRVMKEWGIFNRYSFNYFCSSGRSGLRVSEAVPSVPSFLSLVTYFRFKTLVGKAVGYICCNIKLSFLIAFPVNIYNPLESNVTVLSRGIEVPSYRRKQNLRHNRHLVYLQGKSGHCGTWHDVNQRPRGCGYVLKR